MDKEWIHLPSRLLPEYEEGVQKFLVQAKYYAKTRFDPSYLVWYFHGETDVQQFQGEGSSGGVQEEEDESREAFHLYRDVFVPDEEVENIMSNARDYEFDDLLKDAETPLFPGCTAYTKFLAAVTLYNYKSTNGHTDSSFNDLLKILVYEKIHACPNDCCLFRKELKDLDSCPKCGSSRWKVDKVTSKFREGVPEKVLRYFPVIPRLKRMFKSEDMVEDMIWRSNHKSQDHMMRHPVDSVAWDTINHKWPAFTSDPRNIRLGLATDGFNPFGDLSSRYSCWPVMLVNYNLPPLMCMSNENIMLTLLIPGPKQPGNYIDVHLEPLVEDLNELWHTGVEAYDAFSKSALNLKAILMWTIHDFPAYGNLAGCATTWRFGCPICGEDVCSMWLKYSRKFSYLGHRRFLAPDHAYRDKKKWFNGKKERKGKPRTLSGLAILAAVKVIENYWGKKIKGENLNSEKIKRKKQVSSKNVQKPVQMWKKKSIFFNFSYWSGLVLRHNLDVMHVVKNVCENIIGTLLNVKSKTKDGVNARKDLMHLNIRKELHPQEKGKNMYHLPAAPYTLSKKEMDVFCFRLKKIKLPDGYSSNIGNCVSLEDRKLIGLKSHDCHVLMQQLLSVALRNLLPKGPRSAIFLLCAFYNELCQRIFMKTLKEYVKNRARPEGCIAECYLAEERMRFCSAYIKKAASIGVRANRNQDLENGLVEGRPISQGIEKNLEDHVLQAAH
ncbi:uncharacterized protein [Henckelia pumila]|uniref:uncharacterized protein n=1 Tax=Henckelia pumila TaxID=405737 RepID=UPI003C6E95B2